MEHQELETLSNARNYAVISAREKSPSQPNTPLTVDNVPTKQVHSYK